MNDGWGALLSQKFDVARSRSNKKFQTKFYEMPSFLSVPESQVSLILEESTIPHLHNHVEYIIK